MIHYFDQQGESYARGVSEGQTVTFTTDGDAVLEKSDDIIHWQVVSVGSTVITHTGPRMPYRMRGTTGNGTLEIV